MPSDEIKRGEALTRRYFTDADISRFVDGIVRRARKIARISKRWPKRHGKARNAT